MDSTLTEAAAIEQFRARLNYRDVKNLESPLPILVNGIRLHGIDFGARVYLTRDLVFRDELGRELAPESVAARLHYDALLDRFRQLVRERLSSRRDGVMSLKKLLRIG